MPQKACNLNDSSACSRLADYYKHGYKGLKKNCSKALSLYKKSCELGNQIFCKKLGK